MKVSGGIGCLRWMSGPMVHVPLKKVRPDKWRRPGPMQSDSRVVWKTLPKPSLWRLFGRILAKHYESWIRHKSGGPESHPPIQSAFDIILYNIKEQTQLQVFFSSISAPPPPPLEFQKITFFAVFLFRNVSYQLK